MTRDTCARRSTDRDEPLAGTASQVRRWVLVEQPGAWGIDALLESGLPDGVGARLELAARRVRARALLIRRYGRTAAGRRSVFLVSSRRRTVTRLTLDDPAELDALDLSPLGADRALPGDPVDVPLLLTCTNGRHDPCCSEFGRPIAAALDAAPEVAEAWECSHIGGDRFAGNLLVLPHGLYYGRVEPADALEIAAAHGRGEIVLRHYRGRSLHPFAVQAAEASARAALDVPVIDDLVVTGWRTEGARTRVHLQARDERWVATVRSAPSAEPFQLTCRARRVGAPPRHDLEDLAPAP